MGSSQVHDSRGLHRGEELPDRSFSIEVDEGMSPNENGTSSLSSLISLEPKQDDDEGIGAADLVGKPSDHAKVRHDRRDKHRIVAYEPTQRWWKPPLRAWLHELNHEIWLLLVLWNISVALLARYTSFCGGSNGNTLSLCDEEWVMNDDIVFNALGVGMFLLLAFRAHEGYDRFWDGRKAWGRIRECCRDMTRQICYHISVEEPEEKKDRRRAVAFVAAFASTLKLTLRRERNSVPELGEILCFQDILNIERANIMPQFCLDVLTNYLVKQHKKGRLGEYTLGVMTSTCIAPMVDAMGSCERIRNTPIPLSYTLHLRFFVVVWLALYPLHLVSAYGWYSIPLTSLIDYAVLGIEAMACEIENPFGYHKNCIDLCAFCKGIVADTQEILKRVEHPQASSVMEGSQVWALNCQLLSERRSAGDRIGLHQMYHDRAVCRKK
uniref:Bestrophin homolog n=1 Tax=Pseudo-nitzschia delicatissima TaxID=44447 RepID=A0A7S0XQN2_9STRA|mmetsp:Transcript_608/g.1375  ORF Transcript_608/g.1375 Transcript_608/m.1375 type:complete len:438 (+) Transcript_608:102-1415(+)